MSLRRQSFDMLRCLVKRRGRVVSRSEIVAAVWDASPADPDASVFQCIKEIRKSLGEDARWMIRTVPGAGYEFKAPVEELCASEEAAPALSGERDADDKTPLTRPPAGLAGRVLMRRPRLTGAIALAVFLALPVLGALVWSAVSRVRPRDALTELFLYRPAGKLMGGVPSKIETSDGRTMICIGGVGDTIARQCRWDQR